VEVQTIWFRSTVSPLQSQLPVRIAPVPAIHGDRRVSGKPTLLGTGTTTNFDALKWI
jgi:hypothetical protein